MEEHHNSTGDFGKDFPIVEMQGDEDLLKLHKTAFLCSRKIPSAAVLKCYDWAIAQRDAGRCVVSGFHSTLEQDVFHYLAKGEQPIILVLARGMKKRWEAEIQKMLDRGRFLIITPFNRDIKRSSKRTAALRNKVILSLADAVCIGYLNPEGKLQQLLQSYSFQKPVQYLVKPNEI